MLTCGGASVKFATIDPGLMAGLGNADLHIVLRSARHVTALPARSARFAALGGPGDLTKSVGSAFAVRRIAQGNQSGDRDLIITTM